MKKNNVFCFCYLIFIFLDSTRFLQNFEFVKLSYFLIVLSPKTVRMVTFEPVQGAKFKIYKRMVYIYSTKNSAKFCIYQTKLFSNSSITSYI